MRIVDGLYYYNVTFDRVSKRGTTAEFGMRTTLADAYAAIERIVCKGMKDVMK